MKVITDSKYPFLQIIDFDSTKNLNQISDKFLMELCQHLEDAENNNDIKVVLLYGGTKGFSCGSKVEELVNRTPCEIYNDIRYKSWKKINNFSKIMISSVSRMCSGSGFELALCSDEILSSDSAVYSSPEVALGLIPGAGAVHKLSKSLNRFELFNFLTSNKELSAKDLFHKGLISEIFNEDDLFEQSLKYCEKFKDLDPTVLTFLKSSLRQNESNGFSDHERALFSLLHAKQETLIKLKSYSKA
jgi:enoyl-CoA hydratase/carnithine racemase